MPEVVSGTGSIRTVPTGTLVQQQLPNNNRVRLSQPSSPPNVEFSGFLSNALADGTVVGRSLVVDDINNPNDVPDATGFGILTLENVTVQGPFAHPPSPRTGTLVIEQRTRSNGFIFRQEGVTFSTQYTVIEGRGGLSNVRGGAGVGVGFTSLANPANPVNTANYWLQLEFP